MNDQDITSVFFDVIDFIEVILLTCPTGMLTVHNLNKCWHPDQTVMT